jgi:multiple sugar transport system permease protein
LSALDIFGREERGIKTAMIRMNKKVTIISAIVIAIFVLWTIIPIVLIMLQSVKPRLIMFVDPPVFIFRPTPEHFMNIFQQQNILHFMMNSLIISTSATALCLTIGTMSAYAFSALKFPGKNLWAVMILITRMVPVGTLMVPIFVMMRVLRLANTYFAVIFTHAVLNLAFVIWMMWSFFNEIPKELEQAAMVDGCSKMQSFIKISLPLASAGFAATGILTMLNSWNEFMFALILSNHLTRTLPISIANFMGVAIDWGGSTAAAVVACAPIFIAGIFIQKYLIRGLTAGAIKG